MEGHLVDKIVKFNSQASGRDKLFRSRTDMEEEEIYVNFLRIHPSGSYYTWPQQHDLAWVKARQIKRVMVDPWIYTRDHFTFILRVGKSVDFVHSALQSLHISDNVLRWTITLSKLNQAVYLFFDHIVLAGRIGIAKVDKDKWNELSSKFWLVTLLLGIIRDLYDITTIIFQELRRRDAEVARQLQKLRRDAPQNNTTIGYKGKSMPTRSQVVQRCLVENKPLVLDLAKNMSDLVLPLEALGHIKASPGVQGLAGIVSSVIGIITTWQPILRLVPS